MSAINKPFLLHIFEDRVVFEKTSTGSALVLTRGVRDSPLDAFVDEKGRVLKELTGGQLVPVDAIYGIYHLLSGPYIALVTDSEQVVSHGSIDIRKVTKAAIIPLVKSGVALSKEKQADEDAYLELLHEALSGHAFFFSYTWDLTHTLQRVAMFQTEERKRPLWQRADERFFWNKDVLGELVAAKAHDFIVPMVNAHLDWRPNCAVAVHRFHLLFISRRSRFRQGCRFTMRGIDEDGHVANFVETEQALLHEDGKQTSYVQIRGSMPLYWSSPVCMKYTPKVEIGDMAKSAQAARKHVEEVVDVYGPLGIIFVNLVNKKKDEQRLGIGFKEVLDKLQRRDLRYVWFDFHHECRKMKYQNLYKLVTEVDEDFQKQQYFARAANGTVTKLQKGVVRTNCMDNLDRTNVVQSLFGRRSLLLQLETNPAMLGNVLESPYKDFEKVFKDVWANNADAISTYYSGTGALKTDFTRTGKRTLQGVLSDGMNSVMRYYKNNFTDGPRQDSIDLLLGRYRPDPAALSPLTHPPAEQESLASFLNKLFVVLVAIFSVLMLVRPKEKGLQKLFLVSLGLTTLIFLLMVFNLVKKGGKMGKALVAKPRLVPEPYISTFYAAAS